MKYVLINIKNFILHDVGVFLLAVVCVVSSAMVINFSYGLFHHYQTTLDDASEGVDYMTMSFPVENGAITKAELSECLEQLQGEIGTMKNTIQICTLESLIDGDEYQFKFGLDSDGICLPEEFVFNIQNNGLLTEGNYWTAQDEKDGSLYALCCDYRKYGGDYPVLDKVMLDENTLLIGGKQYQIIGYQNWTEDGAMIPYASCDDAMQVTVFDIWFSENVFTDTYQTIYWIFLTAFGDRVTFEDIPTISNDMYLTYKTVILVVVLLACIAALNYVILYKYIIVKRKRTTRVFWLLGKSKRSIICMNLLECVLLNIPLYLAGVLFYLNVVADRLESTFEYINEFYGIQTECGMFFTYVIVSFVICLLMLISAYRGESLLVTSK